MRSNLRRLFVAAFLIISTPAPMFAAGSRPSQLSAKLPFRIAFVSYSDSSRSADADRLEAFLREYARELKRLTRSESAELEVEIVKGNYYQVCQWLRDGSVHAGVVPPFAAYLLTNDSNLIALPLVEFMRPHDEQAEKHTAARIYAERNRMALPHPNDRYAECLDEVLASVDDPSLPATCEIRLVNHLSTTGFIQPLQKAKEYLHDKSLRVDQEAAFWRKFLEHTHFCIWHDGGQLPRGLMSITFSYAQKHGDEQLTLENDAGYFNDVLLLTARREAPASPANNDKDRLAALRSDRLVARSSLGGLLDLLDANIDSETGTLSPHSPWVRAGNTAIRVTSGSLFNGVAPWSEDGRTRFAKAIRTTFDFDRKEMTPLRRLYNEWYELGRYAFTIDELVDLLRVDQTTRRMPAAALVLPGGGVRATYQSVILDHLYGSHKIANACDRCGASNDRLQITSIAGTSGGALLGALAVHRMPVNGTVLTDPWIDAEGNVLATPWKIFPPLGVFRWLSILLVLLIFAGVSAVNFGISTIPPRQEVPVWFTICLTGIIVGAPFLIWRNTLRNPSYPPLWEGLAFVAVVLVAHYFHSVSVCRSNEVQPIGVAAALIAIAMGLCAVVAEGVFATRGLKPHAGAAAQWWAERSQHSLFWSLVSTGAIVFVIVAFVALARFLGVERDSGRRRSYLRGVAVLLLLVGVAAAFFMIGRLTGDVTELEMSSAYWIWIVAAGLFASKLMVEIRRPYLDDALGRSSPPRHLAAGLDGFNFLNTYCGTTPFHYTPTLTLIGWGGVGIFAYLIFIAPALYSSDQGRKTFDQSLHTSLRSPAMSPDPLIPLVVSITAFGEQLRDFDHDYHGDYYAYDDSWESRISSRASLAAVAPRLHPLRRARFAEAIFASGSPFPIYPAAKVELMAGRRPGLFVDGGYAHRVPIEAALATGAEQILIVENVARREDGEAATKPVSRVGALSVNIGRAANYLFDRSQRLDLERSKSVLVGTIHPDWETDNPFLMDFRPAVVRWLREEARQDLRGHRVGRVESWGTPQVNR